MGNTKKELEDMLSMCCGTCTDKQHMIELINKQIENAYRQGRIDKGNTSYPNLDGLKVDPV